MKYKCLCFPRVWRNLWGSEFVGRRSNLNRARPSALPVFCKSKTQQQLLKRKALTPKVAHQMTPTHAQEQASSRETCKLTSKGPAAAWEVPSRAALLMLSSSWSGMGTGRLNSENTDFWSRAKMILLQMPRGVAWAVGSGGKPSKSAS